MRYFKRILVYGLWPWAYGGLAAGVTAQDADQPIQMGEMEGIWCGVNTGSPRGGGPG